MQIYISKGHLYAWVKVIYKYVVAYRQKRLQFIKSFHRRKISEIISGMRIASVSRCGGSNSRATPLLAIHFAYTCCCRSYVRTTGDATRTERRMFRNAGALFIVRAVM